MYRQSEKNFLNSNISSTCPHNMVYFSRLTAKIGLPVWDTPANFNRFRMLASSLHQRRSTDVNQPLHDVWPLTVSWAGTPYTHFPGLLPLRDFCQVQNSLCIQVLRFPILAALLHGTWAVGLSQTLRRSARNGIKELLSWQGATYIRQDDHHIGHWPHPSTV